MAKKKKSRCSKCKRIKPASEFNKKRSNVANGGLKYQCRDCERQYRVDKMSLEQFLAWRKKELIKAAKRYGIYTEPKETYDYDDYYREDDYSNDIAPYQDYIK